MRKRIINLIDSADDINIGIWNSVSINSQLLQSSKVDMEIWYPATSAIATSFNAKPLDDTSVSAVRNLVDEEKLNPNNDLIVSHGVWQYPTRWGNEFKKMGFRWIYVPHGMLEPWPLRQKWLKKKLYFHLIEKRLAINADILRAVSKPEALNLAKLFPEKRIEFIPNGVSVEETNKLRLQPSLESGLKTYLFLSRLHHKKNVLALAQAWLLSKLNNNKGFRLIIAGPDQGELKRLLPLISSSSNIVYVGEVGGQKKYQIFDEAHYFVLPSFSEGLPSALLEAMSRGLVPVITEGCNFPEVFEHELGEKITTDKLNIKEALERVAGWPPSVYLSKSELSRTLINESYSLEAVTERQLRVYFS